MKALAFLLMTGLLAAQTEPAKPQGRVIGELTAKDDSANKLTVKTDAGLVYTVSLDEKTLYLRVPPGEKDLKKAARITLTDLNVGDRLIARGAVSEETKTLPAASVLVMTKADLAKKGEQDRAEWQKRGISGTVASVNPETAEIVVTVQSREGAKPVTVSVSKASFRRYAPDSVRFSDAKPSSLADVTSGDRARVLGDKNEDGSKMTAEVVVSGSFRTLAATVIAADAATGDIRVKDLQSKETLTVHTNADSKLHRMPEAMAAMMARRRDAAAGSPGAPGATGPGTPGSGASSPGAGSGGPPNGAGTGSPRRTPDGQPIAAGQPPVGGTGGAGRMGGGGSDFQQMIERMPVFKVAELKAGDALIISSTNGADKSNVTAISLIAGVEPFLAAAPRNTAGQVNLGNWNFDIGGPAQ